MEGSLTMTGIFLVSFIFFVGTCRGDFPSGAIQTIRCMLLQSPPDDCASVRGVPVPPYLTAVYNDLPSTLHEALLSKELKKLSNAEVASLPLSILYLIPRARLADLTGAQLGAILQQHADDTSLAQQISSSLQTTERLLQILHKLKVTTLSQDAQRVLGEWIQLSDLTEESLSSLPYLQEPILAYVRPSVLFHTDVENFHRVMVHLRETDNKRLPRKEVVHVIAAGAVRHQYMLNKIHWLVEGLTPDEIKDELLLATPSTESFKLDLSSLQARALFERVYRNVSLHRVHFLDSKPLLSRLSPRLLQKFPAREQKYDGALLQSPLSLPTALQIREYVKADCQLTGKLPKDAEEWGNRIRYLGPWVFTLPLARLEEYLDNPLNEGTLQTAQSHRLSPLQMYYLTGRGSAVDLNFLSTVTGLFTFLHALPASQLTGRRLGEINSALLQHLVNNLPADNLPRTLSLVHKIVSSIGDQETLEGLLFNKDVNGIMSLVSPKDLQTSAPRMIRVFASNEKEFGPIIRKLPQPVLFTFLEEAQKNPNWSWHSLLDQTHIFRYLVGGLSCQHVEEMDTGLFIPILAEYNRHRDQSFPKNLQHCCLLKLISHLELKMALSQADESKGLLSLLEPVEIEAVGGYVLLGLPVEGMNQSPYLGNLIAAIGKLSNAELILATNFSHLQEIAKLAVNKEGQVDAFHAGNLVWFAPLQSVVSELRVMLETGQLDTTLCLPAESRQIIASRLLTAFGPPESWTASVLAALQDLLIVFKDDELRVVGRDAWTEAADSLSSRYGDNVEWIQSAPFYQICMNRLGKFEEAEYKSAVAQHARYLLKASQWQLDTVSHESEPDKDNEQNMIPVSHQSLEEGITVRVFHPHIIHEFNGKPGTIESEVERDDKENEVEGEGNGDAEEYEDEEENKESEERYEVVTAKRTPMESISTETSKIEKQDVFNYTHIKPTTTTDKTITFRTTTTIKQNPLSSEPVSNLWIEVTPQVNITNKEGLVSESPLIPINNSFTEEKGSASKHHNKSDSKEETTTKTNHTGQLESHSEIDNKISLEPVLNETEIPKKENISTKINNTEFKTTALTNVTLTSTPIYPNQQNHQQIMSEIKGTNTSITANKTDSDTKQETTVLPINKLISLKNTTNVSESTVLPLNKLNSSNSTTNVSESTVLPINKLNSSNSTTNVSESTVLPITKLNSSNSTTNVSESTVLPINKLNSSNSTTNVSESSVTLAPTETIKPLSVSTNFPPEMSNNIEKDGKEIKTGDNKWINNEAIDKTAELNISVPESAPVHGLKPIESNSINTEDNEEEYTDDEGDTKANDSEVKHTDDKGHIEANDPEENDKGHIEANDSEEEYIDVEGGEEEVRNESSIIKQDPDSSVLNTKRRKRSNVNFGYNNELSCNALRMVGRIAGLALTDIESMSSEELNDCRPELGAMELSPQAHKHIWRKINKQEGTHLFGNLLKAAAVADLWDFNWNIAHPWTLENIQAFVTHSNNSVVLAKLIIQVQKANSEFSPELLTVLGGLVCSLEPDNLRSLSVVGLQPAVGGHCPPCLPRLAQLAVDQLGPVAFWTQHHVQVLQHVVAGLQLSDWKTLKESPFKPLYGLQPSAIQCLNESHLQALTLTEIKQIPTLTLLALPPEDLAPWNITQLWSLGNKSLLATPVKPNPILEIFTAGQPSGCSKRTISVYLPVLTNLILLVLNFL